MQSRLGTDGGYEEILSHPFFCDINVADMLAKKLEAPYIPEISESDPTNNFDSNVTGMDAADSLITDSARRAIISKTKNYDFDEFTNSL